ncbi:MAG: hypothetical protein EOP61_17925 [Sphingomonadales bacterium]|nr:MAG: hypothetical protein EOP61_17925 [Sphingomonadales bacterium]
MRYGRFLIGLAMMAAAPALAQETELAAKERAVQAATARPATWTARAQEFRTWLAGATDDQGKPLSAAARAGHIGDQVHTLDKELARAASHLARHLSPRIANTLAAG